MSLYGDYITESYNTYLNEQNTFDSIIESLNIFGNEIKSFDFVNESSVIEFIKEAIRKIKLLIEKIGRKIREALNNKKFNKGDYLRYKIIIFEGGFLTPASIKSEILRNYSLIEKNTMKINGHIRDLSYCLSNALKNDYKVANNIVPKDFRDVCDQEDFKELHLLSISDLDNKERSNLFNQYQSIEDEIFDRNKSIVKNLKKVIDDVESNIKLLGRPEDIDNKFKDAPADFKYLVQKYINENSQALVKLLRYLEYVQKLYRTIGKAIGSIA